MRRWIAILLLFVLPAQFSWAAAAGYCQHEKDSTPQHLGHHEHHHQKAAASANAAPDASPDGTVDGGSGSKLPGAHADCAYCHFSLAKSLTTISHLPLLLAATSPPRVGIEGVTSYLFERIERPNWHRA